MYDSDNQSEYMGGLTKKDCSGHSGSLAVPCEF